MSTSEIIMKTDPALAEKFCTTLFHALQEALTDTPVVLDFMEKIKDHAPTFPETRFTKGCVLPVVDRVATKLLTEEFQLSRGQITKCLLCEGFTSLPKIYIPSHDQSGFGGFTWGTNYQPYYKDGRPAKLARGAYGGPDFGVRYRGDAGKFSMCGEVKLSKKSCDHYKTRLATSDINAYVSLPCEPEKNWDYDFGFALAYATGGDGPRKSYLIDNFWKEKRLVVAVFEAQ
jgi:hypothetical protein